MLVIRLARTGRTKYPTYRIVAADSARAATGRFVAALGHYNPHTKELVVKREETERYLSNGAQPSNSVIKLLTREGVELPKWAKLKTKAPKKSDEPEITEDVVGDAAAGDTEAEAVVEEAVSGGDEVKADEPAAEEAPTEEVRVGTVAEDAASDAADDATSTATQETAASDEADAEVALENEAAADASASEAETKEAA